MNWPRKLCSKATPKVHTPPCCASLTRPRPAKMFVCTPLSMSWSATQPHTFSRYTLPDDGARCSSVCAAWHAAPAAEGNGVVVGHSAPVRPVPCAPPIRKCTSHAPQSPGSAARVFQRTRTAPGAGPWTVRSRSASCIVPMSPGSPSWSITRGCDALAKYAPVAAMRVQTWPSSRVPVGTTTVRETKYVPYGSSTACPAAAALFRAPCSVSVTSVPLVRLSRTTGPAKLGRVTLG
mmetsp:Transcript_2632/g.8178  ORF Transcript_2632/g.8178 Transcript_2632/m.8178 type:complete len:235 (+) Transcript_2632:588-1292(+)